MCFPFCDFCMVDGDTMAERYESMAKLEQFTRVWYKVEMQWEWEFDKEILDRHPEMQTLPVVEHRPLNTLDALYGNEQRPCDSST